MRKRNANKILYYDIWIGVNQHLRWFNAISNEMSLSQRGVKLCFNWQSMPTEMLVFYRKSRNFRNGRTCPSSYFFFLQMVPTIVSILVSFSFEEKLSCYGSTKLTFTYKEGQKRNKISRNASQNTCQKITFFLKKEKLLNSGTLLKKGIMRNDKAVNFSGFEREKLFHQYLF